MSKKQTEESVEPVDKPLFEEEPDPVSDENAKVEGNDVAEPGEEHDPRGDNVPEPGTTPDTQDILNTPGAKALSPNITVSGTKPDGHGGQELLDTVDPQVANAGILPPKEHKKPENPSLPPENANRTPGDGEVWFECTADNEPWYSSGAMKQGHKYVMTKEEADLLTQTKAGHVV